MLMSSEQSERKRCFGQGDELMADYHDNEWGIPVRDSRELFEHLTLDIFQSGLSWRVILSKRENFREAFDHFDPRRIAGYQDKKLQALLTDEGIVRNRRKIEATIQNAQAFQRMAQRGEDFSEFLWSFVGGEPIKGPPAQDWQDLPTKSERSAAMAKSLKDRGFQFVGPTVCYAFMQAVGMIDDHLVGCFRYQPANRG
jgi:DNA-3-methyladenine glycosylase I